jgi:hypothetical protein
MSHHDEKHEEAEEPQEDIELTEEQSDEVKGGATWKLGASEDATRSDKV